MRIYLQFPKLGGIDPVKLHSLGKSINILNISLKQNGVWVHEVSIRLPKHNRL